MSPVVLLTIIVMLPVVLLTFLRVNAAMVFLSLCLGSVLVQFIGSDAVSLIATFSPHASSVSENTLQIGLLVLPAALTTIFMFHTVRKMRVAFNVLPAITVGLLLVLLIQPYLSPGLQGAIVQSSVWHHYIKTQSLVVGSAALINLAFLWFDRRGHPMAERGSKRR